MMPDPKFVIAMGACTVGGGPYFKWGYHVVKGVDLVVPVDVYVPGCPPRPDMVIDAIIKLQQKISREDPLGRLLHGAPETPDRGTGNLVFQPNRGVHKSANDKHAHDPESQAGEAHP